MCFKSTEEVAAQLASWKLGEHYKHVYVANRDFSPGKARSLLEAGGFDTVVSAATTCRRQAPGSARSGGAKCGRTPEVGWWSRGRCGLCSAGWCGTAGAAQRKVKSAQLWQLLIARPIVRTYPLPTPPIKKSPTLRTRTCTTLAPPRNQPQA